jgi:hypothetical protein
MGGGPAADAAQGAAAITSPSSSLGLPDTSAGDSAFADDGSSGAAGAPTPEALSGDTPADPPLDAASGSGSGTVSSGSGAPVTGGGAVTTSTGGVSASTATAAKVTGSGAKKKLSPYQLSVLQAQIAQTGGVQFTPSGQPTTVPVTSTGVPEHTPKHAAPKAAKAPAKPHHK